MAISEKRISTYNSLENEYQVFLNFKGSDTRRGFTNTLYHALVDYEIHVFMDEGQIEVGKEIGHSLIHALDDCRFYIPIFSRNYASSAWCLRELARMMDNISKSSEDENMKVILPIFYDVTPDDVRLKTSLYSDSLLRLHEGKYSSVEVQQWRQALKRVCQIRGFDLQHYEGDADLAKVVADTIMNKSLPMRMVNSAIELVGIDDRVEQIMDLMDAKFNDTKIFGIYGMEGIGKTTLARVLYNNLSSRFKHLSFVANIRETSLHKGITFLQKQLINDILLISSVDVSTVNEGINVIKSQFTSKKVLILLDDIDAKTQLNALAGDINWFKAGSIIIITAKNKSIFDQARAVYPFELKKLSSNQSLILLHRHAFQTDYPRGGYERISSDVVSNIGSLPLTLEVIGSFLHGRRKEECYDTLRKLKEVPNQKVQEILRISYEELDARKQNMFLDIACFFIGSSMQSPTYMWEACGFYQRDEITVLRCMSLIKIEKDGKVMMHDQLRDLGREIVHLENPKEPQERSRLWIYEEAAYVFENNQGTSKIEALCLDKYDDKRSYTGEQFKELTKLRFLQVCGSNFIGDFHNLLPQLRWLQWEHCPLAFTAVNFHPKNLVVLNLLWNEISEDWGGWYSFKVANKLKVLNLTGCRSLRRTPDLSAFESLEILILEECENLEEIHHSIEDIKTLVSLNVRKCERLKELPTSIGGMKKLKELLISETNIQEIPILGGGLMELETLCASWCTQLAQLPESMGTLESLTQLDISHSMIEKLPESMGSLVSLSQLDLSHSYIEELPHFMGSLVRLTQLDLSHSGIVEFPESIGSLRSLTQLDLSYSGIEELPKSIDSLKKLETLNVSNCALAHIHSSIGHLTSLSLLDLRKCCKLAQLPVSIGSLMSLQRLLLRGCDSLRKIPDSIGELTSLTELDLKSTMIAELPQSIEKLQNLRILDIRGTHITELPVSGLPQRLLSSLLSMTRRNSPLSTPLPPLDGAGCPRCPLDDARPPDAARPLDAPSTPLGPSTPARPPGATQPLDAL